MSMERRDLFKLAGVAAAVAVVPAVTGCAAGSAAPASFIKKASGKSVVIIGGGWGGLTMAKELRKLDKSLDVTLVEKKDIFMSCPVSNLYLGGLESMTLAQLTHDFYAPAKTHGYTFIQGEVTEINRASKYINTTSGALSYDILVLSPGIAYDYEKQFPTWDSAKISQVAHACPAALMPGSEHLALKRQLDNMDDGNVIIVPPAKGKFRCPPAPYERTSMVANYMKKEGIQGKVIVLDTRPGKFAKAAAFKESWNETFADIIEYRGESTVTDVDTVSKTITYTDGAGKSHTESYQVCNLIPINKCSPVTTMAGIKTNASGFAAMEGFTFRSASDKNVYVIGDAVGHKIPPSGQTAIWGAKRAAGQIVSQVKGKALNATAGLPEKAANVCYSMVNGMPEEAIMVTHTFSADPSGTLKGKGAVPKPKDGNGKFRSKGVGKALHEWYNGSIREMFS
ncbi:MAG: Sulfide dehydrogenase [flavocytochrome C] flavoprotein chain precursor (EC [uncultured Sulfurovum sp.]|uniref:Sulfide dehydrogenase [flavocytochrome C] flavoprotein chain (EC) n=1 Tax=uncultured Sulfurovum sp. TaxID=269237 RepID=A0A6S6S8U5_9BACT|nr:MAG: Sulfide dehydrogenase [flavocytochrome C] flavoprotein chain precursor (EC [uncultured Sulfurovum sp.]